MACTAPSHRRDLASPAATLAERQRSLLAELIAAIAPGDSEAIADRLLGEFHSLGQIWTQSPEALARVLGPQSPVISLIQLVRRTAVEAMAGDLRGSKIDPFSPALRQYLVASMGSLPDETLRILFLDSAHCLIADEQLQTGTLAQLALHPRTIFRRALEHNAAGIILVHNHPSGDPRPSAADIEITRRLDRIGRALDIEVVDHIVVTAAYAHHIVNAQAASDALPEPATCMLKSPPGADIALANALATTRRRLLRLQLVGAPELFGDPAWEMLVDLFVHECARKQLSVKSVCVASTIPVSSALRLVDKLCDAGILLRTPDPFDGRRSFVRLAPTISHRLRAYFEEGPE